MNTSETVSLNYPIILYPAEEGGYVAEIPSLAGCIAQGETMIECLNELETVKSLWIESARMNNESLPDATLLMKKVRNVLAA